MSFIKSITKDEMLSRLVGGQSQEKQNQAAQLLNNFFEIIEQQMQFGNRVIIRDFGQFEPLEKQLPGKNATYSISFKPGTRMKAAAKHLDGRFPNGMPAPMKNAITAKTHGGKGTGNEDVGE